MNRRAFASRIAGQELFLLAMLLIVVLLGACAYLNPFSQEFPMDDSYIHLVYAENLAEGRGLYFSFPDEQGVGTTSILWVGILAAGHRAGISMVILAKLLGLLALLIVSQSIYLLLKPLLGSRLAWLGALLPAISGNMLWFTLSGMETMLFVALGLLALLAYRRESWLVLGLLLGGLALTRPEGILLGVAVGLLELLRQRKITRGLVIAGFMCLLIASPWYSYLFLRTGHFLPTSAVGKQLTYRVAMQFALDARPGMAWVSKVPALVYLGSWIIYVLEFSLGGMSLPGPYVPLASVAEGLSYKFSIWAVPAWVLAGALILAGIRRFWQPSRWRSWLERSDQRPWFLLLLWVVIHNGILMIFMPVPGTASRYGAINYVLLWAVLLFGVFSIINRRTRWICLVGIMLIALVNGVYWDGVYQANLEHMRRVRMAAATYIREQLPQETRCAASDVGAIRYFTQSPIIDMGALVNPEAGRWFAEGASDEYLLEQGATCLVVPGRHNNAGEGWFDIVTIMGLNQSSLLQLEQLAVFEIEHDRWLKGYLPTNNYQASVVVYRLIPRE